MVVLDIHVILYTIAATLRLCLLTATKFSSFAFVSIQRVNILAIWRRKGLLILLHILIIGAT